MELAHYTRLLRPSARRPVPAPLRLDPGYPAGAPGADLASTVVAVHDLAVYAAIAEAADGEAADGEAGLQREELS
jgi:hypothetical protein